MWPKKLQEGSWYRLLRKGDSSLSAGCRPVEETERDVCLKVKGGQVQKKGWVREGMIEIRSGCKEKGQREEGRHRKTRKRGGTLIKTWSERRSEVISFLQGGSSFYTINTFHCESVYVCLCECVCLRSCQLFNEGLLLISELIQNCSTPLNLGRWKGGGV